MYGGGLFRTLFALSCLFVAVSLAADVGKDNEQDLEQLVTGVSGNSPLEDSNVSQPRTPRALGNSVDALARDLERIAITVKYPVPSSSPSEETFNDDPNLGGETGIPAYFEELIRCAQQEKGEGENSEKVSQILDRLFDTGDYSEDN